MSGKTNCADITTAELAGVAELNFLGFSSFSSLIGSNLKSGDFAGLTGLTNLNLDSNQLTTLPADIFSGLSALTTLTLNNNQLSTLPTGVFSGLTSLTTLNLSGNSLPTSLPASLFADVSRNAITLPTGTTINEIPTTVGSIPAQTTNLGVPLTVNVADKFSDTGDTLTYTVESNNTATATVEVSGSTVTITPVAIGTADITITATDTAGQTAIQTLMVSVNAQGADPTDLCSRSQGVRDEIVASVNGKTSCADITTSDLAGITSLNFIYSSVSGGGVRDDLKSGDFAGLTGLEVITLTAHQLTTLPADIFSGLSVLEELYLDNNQLSTLPTGIFAGLTSLTSLNLSNNSLPTSLPASLFADVSRNAITLPTGTTINEIPTTVGSIPAQTTNLGVPQTVNVADKFSDTGDTLTYTVESNNTATATVEVSGSVVTITPVAIGTTAITVTAADTAGQTVTQAFMVSVNAQDADPTDLCSRTAVVKNVIVSKVSGKTDCADITTAELAGVTGLSFVGGSLNGSSLRGSNLKSGDFAGLTGLTDLRLRFNEITTLPADIFSGLSALTRLELDNNQLSTLPTGVFSGLISLTTLNLSSNSLPTSLPASLFADLPATATITFPTGTTINAAVPTTVGTIANITDLVENGSPQTVDVANKFSDTGDTLTYTVESNNTATATVAVSGSTITITPVAIGTATITITATDTADQTVTQTFMVSVNAQEADPTDLCSRTAVVKNVIVSKVSGKTNCADITVAELAGVTGLSFVGGSLNGSSLRGSNLKSGDFAGLTGLTDLRLRFNEITTLPADIFSGLSALTRLELDNNQLSTLPTGVFSGLISLTNLNLSNNPLPASLPASLFADLPATATITLPTGTTINDIPTTVGTIANITDLVENGSPQTVDVADKFSDTDDTLTYTVESNNTATVTVAVSGSTVTITPVAIGTADITITATDTAGQTATQTLMVSVNAQGTNPTDLCSRTEVVKNVIISEVSGKTNCADITTAELAGITRLIFFGSISSTSLKGSNLKSGDFAGLTGLTTLNISSNEITTLPADIFSGLSALENLSLNINQLTTLPSGIFSGLRSLTGLNLLNNPLPASLPASLFADVPSTATITLPTGTTINAAVPTTVGTIANITDLVESGSPQTVDVADKFSDPNDTLTYTVESNNTATTTVEVSGSTVTITPVAAGSATITVTATDTAGQTATQTLMVSVNAQEADPTDLCSRTAVVKNVIVSKVSGKTNCADITVAELAGVTGLSFVGGSLNGSSLRGSNLKSGDFAGLTGLTDLRLRFNEITTLPADIFSGLSALTRLELDNNQLSTLPTGVFSGLISLTNLNLSNNPLPASLPASLFADLPATATITLPTGTTINDIPTTVGTIANITDLVENGSPQTVDVANKFSDTGDTLTYTVESNNTATATVTINGSTLTIAPVAAGSATITVTATDTAGQTAIQTFVVTVVDTTPVAVPSISISPATVTATVGTAIANITIDSSGGAVDSYSISPTLTAGLTLDTATATISGTPTATAPSRTYTITASNSAGTDTAMVNITVNAAPVVNNPAPTIADVLVNIDLAVNAQPHTLNVANKFSDPDDTLTYTATSATPAIASVAVSGNMVTITPIAIGTTTITVTAADTIAQTVTQTFMVTVISSPLPNPTVCMRHPKVQEVIIQKVHGKSACGDITAADLAGITSLVLRGGFRSGLGEAPPKRSDFAGLTALITLEISDNSNLGGLTTLPADLFQGLPLTTLTLTNNKLPTLPIGIFQGLSLSSLTLTGNPWVSFPTNIFEELVGDSQATRNHVMGLASVNAALPVTNGPIPAQSLARTADPLTLEVAAFFSDPGDTLTYTATSATPAIASVAISGSTLTITPVALGTTNIMVTARDTAGQPVTQTFAVTVSGDAAAVAAPDISPSVTALIATQAVAITPITIDAAAGGAVDSYSIMPDLPDGLSIDPSSGEISGTPTAVAGEQTYTITATNTTGTDTASVTITVNTAAVADTAPSFAQGASIADQTHTVNTMITALTLPEASGGNGALTYALTPALPAGLSFNANARTISGIPTMAASMQTYTYTVMDSDANIAGGDANSLMFTITVNAAAVADTAPSFAQGASIADQTHTVNTMITALTLPEASGGNGALTYALTPALPAGLSFNANTRTLAGTPTMAASMQTYTYTVIDNDANIAGGDSASLMFTITVNAAAVADTAPSFAQGASIADQTHTVNTMITALTLPEASGGNGALTYALTPALPAGLSFNANTRTLAGTPTMAASMQTYTYTVIDNDANIAGGDSASLMFTITVNAAAVADTAPSFAQGANIANQTHTVNTMITALTLPEASGGNGALTYALTPDLPAGLSFNANTRTLAGTPTMAASMQTYTYTVIDNDANIAGGDSASLMFTITVNAAAVADTAPSFAQGASIADQTHTVNTMITALTLPEASGGNGALTYALTPALPAGLSFAADARTISGIPTMAASMQTYTYTVMDSDANMAGGDANSLTFTITVNAAAVADTAPSFAQGANIANQTHTVNTMITALTLPEASGGNGALTYALTPALPAGLSFAADARTISGIPTMAASMQTYTYTVMDSDANMAGGDANSLTFTITVNAAAVADTAPSFAQGASIADQTHTVNTMITALTLPEASGGNGALTYALTPALPAGLSFNANTRTLAGTPTMAASMQTYTYTVIDNDANIAGGDSASLMFTITVNAAAVADTAPSFAQGASIADQTHTVNTTITTLTLPEASGGNGALTYALTPALPAGLSFAADARTISGIPTMAASMQTYTYTVMDSDANMAGGDANSLTFTITVNAAAVADTAPSFAQGANIANQTHTVNTTITTLTLPEASGGNGALTYALTPALPAGLSFAADARTISGIPTMAASMQTYTYTVMDSDANMAGGDANSLTFTITVNAAAVADTAPSFAQGANIANQTHTVNTTITTLTLPEASGGNGALTYALTPALPAGLSFNANTRTLAGTPTMAASMQTYTYTVIDNDANIAGGDSASLMFTITVNAAAVADTAPSFAQGASIADQTHTVNTMITALTLPEASGGNGALTYALTPALPAGLSFNANTRTLAGTPTMAASMQTYTYTVIDSDANMAGGDANSLTFTITVNAAAVADTAPSFAQGASIADQTHTVNTMITALTLPEASGGNGALTYALTPALPAGLSFAADARTISGIPTMAASMQTYTYTVMDSDANMAGGDANSLTFTITVNAAAVADTAPSFAQGASIADQTHTVNTMITALTLPEASGGNGALTYALTPALPAGLSFNANTRTLAGTPTMAASMQTYTYTVIDNDANIAGGDSASLMFTITVNAAAVADTAPSFAQGASIADQTHTVNTMITALTLPEASGGNGALTYALTPALPAGLSFNANTRTLAGTPTMAASMQTYTYTVIDNDANMAGGDSASLMFTITVNAAAVADTAPSFAQGANIANQTHTVNTTITTLTLPEASGGNGALTYALTPALPAGLSFAADARTISGIPTMAASMQTYTYTVMDSDANMAGGDANSLTFTITVNAAAVADTAPSFAQGANIANQTHTVNTTITTLTLPEASGGNGALTYALTPALPAGLSFNANTRTLAGTPTMAASMQTYTYTVIDNDANIAGGDSASLMFTITVNAAAVADTAPSFAQGASIADQTHTVNTMITALTLPEASGGNGALTYALTPALPAGLSFNANTRTLAGTPTMAASMQTYTYTVIDSDANMAGGDANSLTFTITVNAAAVADTAPSFAQGANIANQTHTVNTTITTLTLPEASGGNGALTYALTPALPAGLSFAADARTISGIPTMAASMQTYTYTVMDSDANMAGGDANSLTFTITVNAAAVADTAPSFAQGASIADQTHTVNTMITALTLPEASGGNGALTYALTPALPAGLSFNANTRTLAGTPTMAASMQTYTYTVIDNDANIAGGDSASLMFTITVNAAAVADTAPSFAQGASIADQTHTVNTMITALTLPEASGGNGALTYALTPALPAGLSFNANTRTLAGTPTMAASMQTYTYTVIDNDANMAGGDSASLMFTITVNAAAVADTAPSFAQGANIANQTHTVNTTITTLTLPEASGGNGALTYALTPALPAGLSFNANTRTLAGTPTMAASMQTYTYTVIDNDANIAGGDSASLMFTITVNAAAVADTAPSFAQGASIADQTHTVNTMITALTLPEASGGNGALTYALTPALPAGLSFNANTRTLAGTPTMAASMQTYTYTVIDNDANIAGGDSASLMFTITVNAAAVADTAPSFAQGASIADQTHTVNTMITALTLPEASGGNGALTYALTPALPAGLSFAADARTISGIPTMAASMQTYTYTVMDSDANMAGGDANSLTFTITVNAAAVADTAPSFAQGANIANQTHTVNTMITALTLPEASGGNGALTYALTPALPAGLSFNANTRTLAGTPTMAASMQTYTYTVMDSDANMAGGDANSLTFTITVNAAAVADTAPSFAQGASIADQTHTVNTMITALTLPEASGGNGTLTYALTPALPAGLSFAADARTISGIPTMAASMQTYTYTVMDSDANMAGGDANSLTFTITVNAAPVAVPTATVSRTVTTNGKSILVGSKTITVESRTIQVEVTTGVGEARTITRFSAEEVLKEVLETIANKAIATGGIDFTKAPPSIDSTITPTLVVNTAVDISVNAGACPAKGCEVTLSYEASDEQAGKDLYVFHYDGAQWEALPHVRRDTINRKVTALATRFSPLALFNASRADKLAKQLNKDILPNLVQTMLASTMLAVSTRMDAAFSGRPQAASYQFDGQTVQLDSRTPLSVNLHNTVEQKLPTYIKALKDDTLDWKRLIGNSSFVMPLNALDEDGGAGATVWGSGEYINLSDKDWKGDVFNVQLGVDQRIKDDLLAGGLVSWSRGDVDYTLGRERGKYTHRVTSIHPYMARSRDGVNLWGSVGYGQGELSIKPQGDNQSERSSNTRLLSLAAGVSGRLTQYGQSGLNLKSDLSLARTNIDGSADIPADKLSSQRLRLLLEIDKERPLASGGRFNPLVEIGLRYDGGTGESGIGAVLGLGGRYANSTGLTVEGKFHTLLGRKDYKEWGIQGVIRQQSGANDQGLTFSLSPSYGATGNSGNQVWERKLSDGNNRNDDYRARLDVNMGYGLFTGGGLLTPYSELRMGDSNHYRLGLRWKPNSPFNLHLYGERKTSNDSDRVLLESHIRF